MSSWLSEIEMNLGILLSLAASLGALKKLHTQEY